jgi:hypothetical protein
VTAAVSEVVPSPDTAAEGDDSLSNARTEEVAADDATATCEGAAPLIVGEPLSEVDNLTAPIAAGTTGGGAYSYSC